MNNTFDLRVVVIGKTGAGKSATANTIANKSKFFSKFSLVSITDKCQLGKTKVLNRTIRIVDTPGLFDTKMSMEKTTKELVKCISMTSPGPHAFLLVINIIDRFTEEQKNTVTRFADSFGDSFYKYTIVVFTRADIFEKQNVCIREYLEECTELTDILKLCDNRYILFNNNSSGGEREQQVNNLICNIDEVVHNNHGLHYTNEMYEEAERTLQRREDEAKRKLEEEERKKVETLQAEFDKKVSLANAEKEKLADEIKKFETEKHIAETREAETKDHISALKNELTECKQQSENRNKEKEERLEKMLHDMETKHAEHIQMLNNKQIDDRVAQLQKQMEESESRRKQQIADLKRENEQKVQEVRDSYTKQQSAVRDTIRNDGIGHEENPVSQVLTGLLGTVRLFTSPSGCSVM